MRLVDRHALIEDVLDEWAHRLGASRAAYGGHAYRTYNYARQLFGSERLDRELALASAFHDLGIWSDDTFDYLPPSIARAQSHLRQHEPGMSEELIAELIAQHHRLRPVRGGADAAVVEAFRRADRVDVSGGLLRSGLDHGFLREVVAVFPYAGFHGILLRTAAGWFVKHPLRPLPMLRF